MSHLPNPSAESAVAFLIKTPSTIPELQRKLEGRLLLAAGARRLVDERELLSEFAADLAAALTGGSGALVDYDEAARISGYSTKQLRRLAKDDLDLTEGSHRNTRFKLDRLPIKKGHRAPAHASATTASPAKLAPARASTSEPPRVPVAPPSSVLEREGRGAYDPRADAHWVKCQRDLLKGGIR